MTDDFQLLSKRQVAKMLKIGRGEKLERLINEGHLRVTMLFGQEKIALAEVRRFVAEGTEAPPERQVKEPARRGPDLELAKILALKA